MKTLKYTLGFVPTVLVLFCIAGIGWWGHRHDWQLPKLAELQGKVEEKEDWCADHGVPESICVECDTELMPKPKTKGWCKIHGNPECVLCNPELAQTAKPSVVETTDLTQALSMLRFSARVENNPICKVHSRRIQLVNEEAVDKVGIQVEPVRRGPVVEFVSASGEIVYDQTRVAHLSSRAPGSVWKVFKHLGDTVKRGDVLALVEASEVGKAKTELLQAVASLKMKTQTLTSVMNSGGAVPESRQKEAEAAVEEQIIRVEAARQALVNLGLPLTKEQLAGKSAEDLQYEIQFLGIPPELVKGLVAGQSTSNLLPVTVSLDGVVTSRDVVVGEVIDNTRVLFEIVDTRMLWVIMDLKSEDARLVRKGHEVRFVPDGSREEISAKIQWISTEADPKTRTIKARAELPDAEGKYRANTYGSGRVILREEAEVVRVPNDAIQNEGCCQIVFIRDKDFLKPDSHKVFHVRKVRTGGRDATHTEVVGVLPGEVVVTKGSGLLLGELLRGDLGEGCACHSKK